jgi:hypothetical protein
MYRPKICLDNTVERPYSSWAPKWRISQDFLKIIRSLCRCTLLWTTSLPHHYSCGLRGNDRSVWHPVDRQDKLLSLQKKNKQAQVLCTLVHKLTFRQTSDLRPAEIPKCHSMWWSVPLHGSDPLKYKRSTYAVLWPLMLIYVVCNLPANWNICFRILISKHAGVRVSLCALINTR